jgi:hypothetical protein
VCRNTSREDAIIIAKSDIAFLLDDIGLEDDIPDDVSDSAEDRQKDLFTSS